MASDGFVIEAVRTPEGEGFNIISREPATFDGLHKIPDSRQGKTSSPFTGFWIIVGVTEADVRSKLTQAGLAPTDIDAKLEWAREWVTTITRPAGSDPVLWKPRLTD
jgi:hypothetical protein